MGEKLFSRAIPDQKESKFRVPIPPPQQKDGQVTELLGKKGSRSD